MPFFLYLTSIEAVAILDLYISRDAIYRSQQWAITLYTAGIFCRYLKRLEISDIKFMNVVSKTPNLLKLRERPIGIWLISAFTALLGMLIFISFDSPIDYFGLLCIFCSNLMMFGSPVQTCIFNKDLNYVTLKQKGWLGTKIIAYPIDEIKGIKIQQSRLVGTQFYRLCLILISGKKFYITQIPSTDRNLQKNLAQYIQQFLILI